METLQNNICRECGSKAIISKGLANFHNIQTSDPNKEFYDKNLTCYKCPNCGHSWIPKNGITLSEILTKQSCYNCGRTTCEMYEKIYNHSV